MTDEATGGAAVLEAAEEELLTLAETIEFLGISKQTLYRMMERGELKGVKVGRQWRFRRPDLVAYLERGPVAVAFSSVPETQLDEALASLAAQITRAGETLLSADDDIDDPAEQKIDRLIRGLLQLAVLSGASDIHLEPARAQGEQYLLVRLRIDGVLHETLRLPTGVHAAIVQRLKLMAGLAVEERGLPQDGRIHFMHAGREYDLRFSMVPSIFGEAVTMRLLAQGEMLPSLDVMHFSAEHLARLREWIRRPSGLVLLSGPTGSGKTTTLYACLKEIATPAMKTLTVEDPVEYALPGMVQVSVNRRSGLTFPVALRAFLRQDPDVIMVGELREVEVTNIVMQAALTGHLVLSTLHTPDALTTAIRLREIGVEPYLITQALIGAVSQRLVRRLCPHCRQPAALPAEAFARVQRLATRGGFTVTAETTFYQGAGCEQCRQRGYQGRAAVYEVMEFTPAVREAFLRGADHEELVDLAVKEGMPTLIADGLRKAADGVTTIEEVLRVVA